MREYFESITDVCPFSLESFDAGKLPILKFSIELVELLYKELKHYDAILFECSTSMDRDALQSTAHALQISHPDAEWFWSHPIDGHKSTVVPALIMQNKKNLAKARKTFKLLRNEN
tara:strand:+ start:428 stop:775 length:348 start_codon:yes stop_codon:yes gene_type:complete